MVYTDTQIQELITKSGNTGKVSVEEIKNNKGAIQQLEKKVYGYTSEEKEFADYYMDTLREASKEKKAVPIIVESTPTSQTISLGTPVELPSNKTEGKTSELYKTYIEKKTSPPQQQPTVSEGLSNFSDALYNKANQPSTGVLSPLYLAGSAAAGAVSATAQFVFHPIQSIKGTFNAITHPKETITEIQTQFKTNPAKAAGEYLVAPVVIGKITDFAIAKTKDVVLIASRSKLPTESIVSPKVLSGQESMPTVRSTKQTVNLVKATASSKGMTVVSASPAKLTSTKISAEFATKRGLEDPGLYATAGVSKTKQGTLQGGASAYFTGIDNPINKTPRESSITLNPLKGLTDIPTITKFENIQKVKKLPSSIYSKPGFNQIESFQKARAGEGNVYITKRSMIGQGEIKAQKFNAPYDINKGNLKVKAGEKRFEKGTSEMEVVIGAGEMLQEVNQPWGKQRIELWGRQVAIERADLILKDKITGKQIIQKNQPIIDVAEFSKGKNLSSLTSSETNIGRGLIGSLASSNVKSSNLSIPRSISSMKTSSSLSIPRSISSIKTSSSISMPKSISSMSSSKSYTKPSYTKPSSNVSLSKSITSSTLSRTSSISSLQSSMSSSTSQMSNLYSRGSKSNKQKPFRITDEELESQRTVLKFKSSGKQKKAYAPSIYAITFGIKGKASKGETLSGLGVRGI